LYKNEDWEEIGPCLHRLPVCGGWLVKYTEEVFQEARANWGWDWRTSITFVPDANHGWAIPAVGDAE